jgi:hypothetical protein
MCFAIADNRQFWETLVGRLFPRFKLFRTFSANEVPADMACFHSGGVYRGKFDWFVVEHCTNSAAQQFVEDFVA